MTNAFASVTHHHLGDTVQQLYQPEDVEIMVTRRRHTACVVDACDGTGVFLNRVGCFMGDADAAAKFRLAFETPTAEWRRELFPTTSVHELIAGCAVTGLQGPRTTTRSPSRGRSRRPRCSWELTR
eukprot:4105213-Pyramimonas_sp.AAC.1